MSEIIDPQNIIAGISVFIAFLAVYMSYKSTELGANALKHQQTHDKLSVRPIGLIELSNHDDRLVINIKNAGMGPMIVKKIATKNNDGKEIEGCPYNWMQGEFRWERYRKDLREQAIKEGDSVIILEYKCDINDKYSVDSRDRIRSILKDFEITVEYEDIYGGKQVISKKLEMFGKVSNWQGFQRKLETQ